MGNVAYTPVCTLADFYAGGRVRLALGTIAMSDSYATGGDTLGVLVAIFSGIGVLKTLAILNQPDGYILEYTGGKVKAYLPSGSPTLSAETAHTHAVVLDGGATAAGASHNHAFTGSELATHQHDAITGGTPAGTVAAPTFTGSELATHQHVAGGTGATGAGASHNHAFTGSELATHQHAVITAGTPAGTNATSTVNPRYQADSQMVVKPTIALTHDANPPTNLNASALYIVEADGEATKNVGRLESTNNGNVDILGETANGTVGLVAASCRFFVNDNDSPGGVAIYINEGSSDQLEFVSPTDTDAWIIMPFEGAAGAPPGCAVAVKVHDNDAAADGKALYFDDNGGADAQLCFVDGGAAGGTIPAADVVVLTPTYIGPAADNIGIGLAEAQVFSGSQLATHQHDAITAGTPSGTNAAEATHTHTGPSHQHAAITAGTPAGTNSAPAFTGSGLATHQHAAITAGTPAGTNAAEATHTHGPGTLADAASAAGSSHTHTATAEVADEVGSGTNLSGITGVPVLAIMMLS